MEKIIEIPEGYEARIEGNKVVLEQKESEDERIREELRKSFQDLQLSSYADFPPSLSIDDILSWLEKQKEQKPERINITDMVAKYSATGEYVEGEYKGKPVNCMIRAYEQGIRDTLSKVKEQNPIHTEDEKDFLEKEVKAFLCNYDKEFDDDAPAYDIAEHFYQLGKNSQKPVEWSEEEKERLESIIRFLTFENENRGFIGQDGFTAGDLIHFLKSLRPQQKQEWSEDDKAMLLATIEYIQAYHVRLPSVVRWLKSLPERFNLHPEQEWSEKDERMLTGIIERGSSQVPFGEPALRGEQVDWLMNRLKSLRPQSHWKPSAEQMEWLEQAVRLSANKLRTHDVILSLYNDLKKLL